MHNCSWTHSWSCYLFRMLCRFNLIMLKIMLFHCMHAVLCLNFDKVKPIVASVFQQTVTFLLCFIELAIAYLTIYLNKSLSFKIIWIPSFLWHTSIPVANGLHSGYSMFYNQMKQFLVYLLQLFLKYSFSHNPWALSCTSDWLLLK